MNINSTSVQDTVGLLDLPDNVIEIICGQFLSRRQERRDRHVRCEILTEVPMGIRNLRATCRRIRNIIDSCPFLFLLQLHDSVLVEEKYWSKLEHLQENFNWKVSEFILSVFWTSFAQVTGLSAGLNKLDTIEKFLNKFSNILRIDRIILELNDCVAENLNFLQYFDELMENLKRFECPINFLVPSRTNFEQWRNLPVVSNVTALEIYSEDDNYCEDSAAVTRTVDLFPVFPNVTLLMFDYVVKDMAPFARFSYLKTLEISGLGILTKKPLVKLPSVTHFSLLVEHFESSETLPVFLATTFPSLEALELDIFCYDSDKVLEHEDLKALRTAQISSQFLFLFSDSKTLKNLALEDLKEDSDLDKLLQIEAKLETLVLPIFGPWQEFLIKVLKRFPFLNYLEIRIQKSHDIFLEDEFLDFLNEQHDIISVHQVKLLVLINWRNHLDRVLFMKPSLSGVDTNKYLNISRSVNFQYDGYFSLTR